MEKMLTKESTAETSPARLSRYASIDLIRGIALFLNVFVHIFTDVFDLNPITSRLFEQPLSVLLLFIAIGYFGSFGSLFILISGTGNMVSMQKGYEKKNNPNQVVSRQIVSGLILLVFSFLVEGFFQFYGYLGTIFAWNSHPHDPTRIIWHAYSITPVTCLAMCMIITGLMEFFLSRNGGYKQYRRNIIIYIVLSILILSVSQAVWDYCKAIGPAGFPHAHIGEGYPGDYKVYMPPPNATFGDYFFFFFLALSAGSNHPIFPYLIMGFVGNIIGILLVHASHQETPDPHMPKKGMLVAFGIFLFGIIMIPILGVDFSSVLPVDAVGDITKIHDGLEAYWLPWWCFLLTGEIIIVFLLIRLIEYRGVGKAVSDRTKGIRLFGIPAFSVYSWHRFWAIPVIVLISYWAGQPSWESGSITETSFGWELTMITIICVWLVCWGILKLWEKIGFIGGIEWMMGTVAALLGKNFRKSKGSTKKNAKWWEYGKMDMSALFYDPEWIALIPRDDTYRKSQQDSLLALKLAKFGLLFGPLAFFALAISRTSQRDEGKSIINMRSHMLSIIGITIFSVLVVLLSLISLNTLGITL
jgi:hypothetical protein